MSTRRQYILNILWSWLGAAALILNGMLVAPYLIRHLGVDTYGIWALGLALVEYFWMIDLGVRPELLPILQKLNINTVAQLKETKSSKLLNDIGGMRKKMKLETVAPITLPEIESWLK